MWNLALSMLAQYMVLTVEGEFGSGEWFATWWPVYSPIIILLLGGASAGIWAIVNRRGGEKEKRKRLPTPTWPEVWARMDEQDDLIKEIRAELDQTKLELKEVMEDRDALRDILVNYADRVRANGGPPLTAQEIARLGTHGNALES